jgi:hypothetical protein
MFTLNLALVSEVEGHDPDDVARVAAALQRQASRDFGPIWGVTATVDAFPTLRRVPLGYWPMVVRDDIGMPGAGGVHLDEDGQPFALIRMSDSWSLTASHEMLEMLADPWGKRLVPGPSPKQGQGRVRFLVEVCDPCESAQFAYTINDTLASDFYTPRFFDPVAGRCVRYDFTGAIEAPRQVLRGGYISWQEPTSRHWFQQLWVRGDAPEIVDQGPYDASFGSVRAWIDSLLDHPGIDHGLPAEDPALRAANDTFDASVQGAEARADALHEQIEGLKRRG